MNSQTAQRPDSKRPARSAKPKRYTKQTAHVEARRDGKPLIFGWGAHLSHKEKQALQRRAVWVLTALFGLLVIAVVVGFWVNLNIIVPNKPIANVNGQSIPQSDFRKMVAVKGQLEANKINGVHGLSITADQLGKQGSDQQTKVNNLKKQIDDLNTKIKTASGSDRDSLTKNRDDLNKQYTDAQTTLTDLSTKYQAAQQSVTFEKTLFTQSQMATDSVQWLQEDLLIRNWLSTQSASIRNQIEPNSSAIDQAVKDFTNNMPKDNNYNKFLSTNNLTDTDTRAMLTVTVRRTNMQNYLASQMTSPTQQVLARGITLSTQKDADAILKQLKSDSSKFPQLAKDKSVDSQSKTKGGDLGWLMRGQYAEDYGSKLGFAVDKWLFDPSRKLNEISPVIQDGGTFHILQIMNTDPSRAVDSAVLTRMKNDAFVLWVLEKKANGAQLSSPDQTMLLDPSNIPSWIPSSPPSAPGTGGAPGTGAGGDGGAVPGAGGAGTSGGGAVPGAGGAGTSGSGQ